MASSPEKAAEEVKEIFPTPEFLSSLVSSFPMEWRGLFAALNTTNNPVSNAKYWLEIKLYDSSIQGYKPPFWSELMEHLALDFPLILQSEISFKPKLLLLPQNLQRNTLSFVIKYISEIPLEGLKLLRDKMTQYEEGLQGWVFSLLKILKLKMYELESRDTSGNDCVCYVDVISKESRPMFNELCERIKQKTGGHGVDENFHCIKWISADSKQVATCFTNKNINESNVHENNDVSDQSQVMEVDMMSSDAELGRNVDSVRGNKEADIPLMIEINDSPTKKVKLDTGDENNVTMVTKVPNSVVKEPPQEASFIDLVAETTELTPEIKSKAESLSSLLQTLPGSTNLNTHTDFSALEVFTELPSNQLEILCNSVGFDEASEQAIAVLCHEFITISPEPSYMNSCMFSRFCILPQVKKLKHAASRILTAALVSFGKKHPKCLCDGVFMKLFEEENLSIHQAEVIGKSVKDILSPASCNSFLASVLSLSSKNKESIFRWTEEHVAVLTFIIDTKPVLDQELFAQLVSALTFNSPGLSKSLKFSKFLLETINKNKQLAVCHKDTFLQVGEGNQTFLKKAIATAVKKL